MTWLSGSWTAVRIVWHNFFDLLWAALVLIANSVQRCFAPLQAAWQDFFDLLWAALVLTGPQLSGSWEKLQKSWDSIFSLLWQGISFVGANFDYYALELWSMIIDFNASERGHHVYLAIIKILLGILIARLIRRMVTRGLAKQLNGQQLMLIRRISYAIVLGGFFLSAFRDLSPNSDLSILLGAAGVFSVAIGFASQTSASNLISGLFLIGEHAIEIDDLIEIDGIIGHVVSVDLLSTKLRTRDYLMVRIPNEKMVQATIINFSRLPIRRLDVMIGVAYKEDVGDVRRILLETADRNPLSLEEPEAEVMFVGFGDSSIDLRFSVWVTKDNFLALKNSLQQEVKETLDAQGIEIPFPHLSIYAGSETEPLPVRNVEGIPFEMGDSLAPSSLGNVSS